MRLFRHFEETPNATKRCAVALGNFDGIHLGHRVVIERARDEGRRRGMVWGVMSFEPHPRAVLSKTPTPFRLTSMRVKAHLIEAMGADFVLMQHFDRAFASISASDFVTRVLLEGLGAAVIVVGQDFVFGRNRGGDAELLARMAGVMGFDVVFVDPVVAQDGTAYSSSVVREALLAGRLDEVYRQLGRHWEIDGHVQRGDARGRQLGYPTANIALGELIRPAVGVYAIRAEIDGSGTWRPGVAYIGPRPTFGGHEIVLEAHLFDFSNDLYGKSLRVALVDFLRPDQRFDSAEALRQQMDRDATTARQRLATLSDQEANP
jgi:riboflavin kinase/FMN adenylyltransferase